MDNWTIEMHIVTDIVSRYYLGQCGEEGLRYVYTVQLTALTTFIVRQGLRRKNCKKKTTTIMTGDINNTRTLTNRQRWHDDKKNSLDGVAFPNLAQFRRQFFVLILHLHLLRCCS